MSLPPQMVISLLIVGAYVFFFLRDLDRRVKELADDVHKLRNDVWGKKLKEKTAPQDVA